MDQLQLNKEMSVTPYFNQPNIDLDTNFNEENFRLVSLASWTNPHVPREKLARFGFYHALQNDHVKCYFCEVVIGDWGIGDDPFTEHFKHSPNCPLINMEATNNVPSDSDIEFRQELLKLNKAMSMVTYKPHRDSGNMNEIHTPRHPDYADKSKRQISFQTWPKSLKQTPDDLSEAGFFYLGVGDEVKCFHCAGCLKDWEPNDSGLEEHKTHFESKCGFIRENYQILKRKLSNRPSAKELVKATPIQINALIDFMNEHTDLRDGKVNSANNKESYIQMWEQLVSYLNKLDGPTKHTKAWREVWRNHKYNKKRKPNVNFCSVVIEEISDENCKNDPIQSQSTSYFDNSQDTGSIKTIPKKRKYNDNSEILKIKLEPPFEDETNERPEVEPNIDRNNRHDVRNPEAQIVSEKNSTIQHTSQVTFYEEQSVSNEFVPTAKVIPKKRKLQEYAQESEKDALAEFKIDNEMMEIKCKNLEFEKMQLELENQKKQLEIEKLKMQLEFAETKRELEKQKDELEKEKNRLAMERSSILIPIQQHNME